MWLIVLGFFKSNPKMLLAALALIAGLSILGYERHAGAESVRKADRAAVQKAKAQTAKREAVATQISANAGDRLQAERVKIQYRTRTLIEKVPVYVSASADAACVVNRGFVLQHDLAASGSSALPPASEGNRPLDGPSGVSLSAVLGTVEGNYGTAYGWREEALTWRRWYAEQKAAWDAKP